MQADFDDARRRVATLEAELAALQAPRKAEDEWVAELEKALGETDGLQVELGVSQGWAAELEAELRTCRDNWRALAEARGPTGAATPRHAAAAAVRDFASVHTALRAAAADFADIIDVWHDADTSAAASSFAVAEKAYQALQAIAEVGRAYFAARDGGQALGPLDLAFAGRVPFKYTPFESATTMGHYGAQRVFHDGGRSRTIERHLTLGGGQTNNCLQIYFDFDEHSRRVVVGYCGRHLPYGRMRT
jgi:hypothetical protein